MSTKRKEVSRWRHAAVVRMVIEARFPKAFRPKGVEKVPLKIGIDRDLVEAFTGTLRPWEISDALTDYTSGLTYLRNMIEGARRIDLDGNDVDSVSHEAALQATERLEKLLKQNAERAAAKEAIVEAGATP